MTILLQLLKLIYPLLREYALSNLRLKRGGQNLVFLITTSTIFVLLMFLGYAVEQATANLQMHEPMIKQYQSLEKNNARLTEQLAESQESAQQCLASLSHPEAASEPVGDVKNVLSHYDPEKKMMVVGSLKDNK